MSKQIVVKLGGSLLSRGEDNIFDFSYLEKLKTVLTEPELSENKYFLAVGGGYTMRKYRDLARAAGIKSDIEIHWVGTTVNVLHAYLVKAYFSDIADEDVVKYEDYYQDVVDNSFLVKNKVKIGGGGRPGHSGDVDAILMAQKLGSDTVVSLKNIDAVYEADPKIYPEAKKVEKLNWNEYLEIINDKDTHEPGGNYPIDPIASRMAKSAGLKFVILAGEDLANFANYLKGREFAGSIVTDAHNL